jgi:hypothetical protein
MKGRIKNMLATEVKPITDKDIIEWNFLEYLSYVGVDILDDVELLDSDILDLDSILNILGSGQNE